MAENTGDSVKPRRGPGRPFQPGQSGNPGGRPAEIAEVKELAREYTRVAIVTLAKICAQGKSESARVAAASALLDRGYGKPAQSVDAKVQGGGVVIMLPPEDEA